MAIRIVTLQQPWATLLAAGVLKKNETRPKAANYSPDDIVLIHAAIRSPRWYDLFTRDQLHIIFDHLNDLGITGPELIPSGAIVGEFKVKEFTNSNGVFYNIGDEEEESLALLENDFIINDTELFLGNYDPGRSIWIGTDHRLLKEPYPYKNGQGYYQKFKGDYNDLIWK